MKLRAIDTFVNVRMGSAEKPDYLRRVAAEYFKRTEQIFKDFSVDEMLADMDRIGVETSVLSVRAENPDPEIVAFAEKHPDRFVLAAYVDPRRGMPALRELEGLFRNQPVVLARVVPFMTSTPPDDRACYPLYAKCIELDIPVNIHTGINFSTASQMDYGRPAYLDEVMQHFPELRVCASPPGWPWVEELIGVAWRHANVHIGVVAVRPKLLGLDDSGYKPLLAYGTKVLKDRILTGTSYPMQPLEQAYAEFDALPLPDDVRRKWMYDNAARFLGLK